MQIPPGDRPKLALLSAGILVTLGMFGVTVVPRLLPRGPHGEFITGSSPARSGAVPAPAAGPRPGAAAASAVAAAPETVIEEPAAPPSTTSTDPFWRPLALSLLPAKTDGTRRPAPGGGAASAPPIARGGPMPGIHLAPIAPPPLPELELQGIVQDDTAMAVLAVGGQVRFLKAGETVANDWIVSRVQSSTVVLRQGKKEIVLTLGQSLHKVSAEPKLEDRPDVRRLANTLPPFHTVSLGL